MKSDYEKMYEVLTMIEKKPNLKKKVSKALKERSFESFLEALEITLSILGKDNYPEELLYKIYTIKVGIIRMEERMNKTSNLIDEISSYDKLDDKHQPSN